MNIAMIGCGWLGKPLALHLQTKHTLSCYSRNKLLEETDLSYVYLPSLQHEFWKNELFIIAISTKLDYLQSLKNFLSCIPSSSHIIFMSSSSVYKGYENSVDEQSPIISSSLQKDAEDLINSYSNQVLILRLGGLMGKDRIAGNWKSSTPYIDGPVNYIHLDDIIQIVSRFIDMNLLHGVYNLVAPMHPLRSTLHKNNAKQFGFEENSYNRTTGRFVDSNKLTKELSYTFIHPDPLKFWT